MNKIRSLCFFGVVILVAHIAMVTISVYAYEENGYKLDIDTSEVHVADTYNQIKNAAVIHLVFHKMGNCIKNNRLAMVGDTEVVAPSKNDVLEKGDAFPPKLGGAIAMGAWLAHIWNSDDGIKSCNNSRLFDMVAYIYKNYRTNGESKSAFSINKLEDASSHVDASDRLEIACNRKNHAEWGLLLPVENGGDGWSLEQGFSFGGEFYAPIFASNKDCDDNQVYRYGGWNGSHQYLVEIFNEVKENSGNQYLSRYNMYTGTCGEDDQNCIDYYDHVDGYYLYSLDFKTQCSDILKSFALTKGEDENGFEHVRGFKVSKEGAVQQGFYRVNGSSTKTRRSFVNQDLTCKDLIGNMNRTIGKYLEVVNGEIFNVCKTAIDGAIDEKKIEITEKYLENAKAASEKVTDAQNLLDEYDRIKNDGEYVQYMDDKTLIQVKGTVNEKNHVFECREHLPYIEVIKDEEGELADVLEKEFYDACYDAVKLGWLVCPVVNSLSGAVDSLQQAVEDFFR